MGCYEQVREAVFPPSSWAGPVDQPTGHPTGPVNWAGQLGLGQPSRINEVGEEIPNLPKVKQVAAGSNHTVLLMIHHH